MDGGFCAPLLAGSTHGLATDRYHARRHASHRGNPGHEAALELFGIENGQDIAQVIMGRRAVLERAEAAEKLKFLDAEESDLGKALGSGQHGEQAQEQDLIERVGHLAWLARILESIEIAQKNNGLRKGRTVRGRAVHNRPSSANRGSAWIQHFSGLSRTPSPDCPASLASTSSAAPSSAVEKPPNRLKHHRTP